MLEKAGYNGERLVLLHTTDQPFHAASSTVVVDALTRVGMHIDDQAMDWGTTLQRRGSKAELDKGGWSVFTSVTPVPDAGSAARFTYSQQWQGRLVRLAHRSED